ncbi:DUF6339 family protein [Caldibacillus lycopersici]|uniref:DUF6339 family protein n=1 Tax=Perspicuibacillus lycopersici TaxID=1325689 RepID=A0AAE3LRP0_9BACI|nr:DUF6339 family protein [Perspicuibacillus lycopersici]MCU9614874.1 DUF6339 family protein [Perspicuibacillus lycopersici]
MKLKFISDDTLMDLRTNFDAYKEYYYEKDSPWFRGYFAEEGRIMESNIEFELPAFNFHENYSVSDRENVKHIYDALKHLTVTQATQERLWAGLAHLQFKDYAFYRMKKDMDNRNDKRINTSLFFRNGAKRSLFVQIISRLWWVGYMTYDETNKENPYWLTDFFTESDFSARSVVFFSSNFTSNSNITRGILRAIVKLRDNGISIKRDHFVQANKYLNVVGAAMILDMLTTEEIEQMVGKYLCRYYGYENLFETENLFV